ncbi:MAG TPA: alpha/beta fold hydrolase [Kofleriaceae bacterium]|nr:alpha/beta fold hydrolase [Kofleriaceae bacterium]
MAGSTQSPERLTATTADGVALALRRFSPAGPRRSVLLCTHAMMSASGYFQRRFAPHLAARGIDVFVLDWRGHGDSVPPSPRDPVGWSFDDYVELDLPAALGAVAAAAGIVGERVDYLGHSLGGLVGLAAFGSGVVPLPRRLALWATSVWLPGRQGSRGRRAAIALYQALSVRGHAPVRALRAGTNDEPKRYVDQLAGWSRTGRWTSRTGIDHLAGLRRVTCPTTAVTGAGDRLCRPRDAAVLAARLPSCAPVRVVGRACGDAADPDHFSLFTDDDLAPLWDELAAFLVQSV